MEEEEYERVGENKNYSSFFKILFMGLVQEVEIRGCELILLPRMHA